MKYRKIVACGSGGFALLTIPAFFLLGNEAGAFMLAVFGQVITSVALFFDEPDEPEPIFVLGEWRPGNEAGDTRQFKFTVGGAPAVDVTTSVAGVDMVSPMHHGFIAVGSEWDHHVQKMPKLTYPLVFTFTGKLQSGKPFKKTVEVNEHWGSIRR